MYLLDTDTLSNLFRGHELISGRIAATPPHLLFVSVITMHETFKGNIATFNNLMTGAKSNSSFTRSSEGLIRLIDNYKKLPIVPFTDEDDATFKSWKSLVQKAGPRDSRIAATALRLNYTVITCNGRDFSRLPNVKFQDWSKTE